MKKEELENIGQEESNILFFLLNGKIFVRGCDMEKQKLSYKIYRPESDAKAVVFCVHGMQEHKMRYDALAKYFTDHQYACITYDLPGHGETAGKEKQGYFSDEGGWNVLVESAAEIAEIAKKEFPNIPVIYFGHSMGTIIGRVFLQQHDHMIDGCILSGIPEYQSLSKIGIFIAKMIIGLEGKTKRSKLLEAMATGSFNKVIENPKTNVDWLSYNENNVREYLEDVWCGITFTNQGYLDLFTLMTCMGNISLYECKHKDLPIYIFAGEDDPCIGGKKGFQNSISLLKKVGYSKIDTKLFEHMRHETLHEDDSIKVMEAAVKWLDQNIKG